MEHVQHKMTVCSGCGYKIDMSTHPKDGSKPKEGDLSMCFRCGQPAQYNADLSLHPLSSRDLAALQVKHPEAFAEYEIALETLEKFWRENGKGPQ